MTYKVIRFWANQWSVDHEGNHHRCVERKCEHNHRTLTGTVRCQRNLIAYDRNTRMWSAAWHGCEIAHSDGTALSEAEAMDVLRARVFA